MQAQGAQARLQAAGARGRDAHHPAPPGRERARGTRRGRLVRTVLTVRNRVAVDVAGAAGRGSRARAAARRRRPAAGRGRPRAAAARCVTERRMRRPKPARMRTGAPITVARCPSASVAVARSVVDVRDPRASRAYSRLPRRLVRRATERCAARAGGPRSSRRSRRSRRRRRRPRSGGRPRRGRRRARGALRSTATARSTRVTLPAVSVASTPTVCRPSGSALPSEVERSVTCAQGAMARVVARRPDAPGPARPSTSTRSRRMPTGSLAPKRSGWSSTRQPGATSGPRAITDGLRDVAHGHDRAGDAQPGEREALVVGRAAARRVEAGDRVEHLRGLEVALAARARRHRPLDAEAADDLRPDGMLHVSPVSGPPITEASPL